MPRCLLWGTPTPHLNLLQLLHLSLVLSVRSTRTTRDTSPLRSPLSLKATNLMTNRLASTANNKNIPLTNVTRRYGQILNGWTERSTTATPPSSNFDLLNYLNSHFNKHRLQILFTGKPIPHTSYHSTLPQGDQILMNGLWARPQTLISLPSNLAFTIIMSFLLQVLLKVLETSRSQHFDLEMQSSWTALATGSSFMMSCMYQIMHPQSFRLANSARLE